MQTGRECVSSNIIIPYPPGFPILVWDRTQSKADKLTLRAKNWVNAMRTQLQFISIGTGVLPTLTDEDIFTKIF